MEMKYKINRKVWQILWDGTLSKYSFNHHNSEFENDVFQIIPYSWGERKNEYHFYHKPSGFKISWYKYALRNAYCNMDINESKFVDILYDCCNSLQEGDIKFFHDINRWWESDNENK